MLHSECRASAVNRHSGLISAALSRGDRRFCDPNRALNIRNGNVGVDGKDNKEAKT
jgi:hypothetical protein